MVASLKGSQSATVKTVEPDILSRCSGLVLLVFSFSLLLLLCDCTYPKECPYQSSLVARTDEGMKDCIPSTGASRNPISMSLQGTLSRESNSSPTGACLLSRHVGIGIISLSKHGLLS